MRSKDTGSKQNIAGQDLAFSWKVFLFTLGACVGESKSIAGVGFGTARFPVSIHQARASQWRQPLPNMETEDKFDQWQKCCFCDTRQRLGDFESCKNPLHMGGSQMKAFAGSALGLVFACCTYVSCNAASIAELGAAIEGVYVLDEWHIDGKAFRPPQVEGRFVLLNRPLRLSCSTK
jgi:hypothetical protein